WIRRHRRHPQFLGLQLLPDTRRIPRIESETKGAAQTSAPVAHKLAEERSGRPVESQYRNLGSADGHVEIAVWAKHEVRRIHEVSRYGRKHADKRAGRAVVTPDSLLSNVSPRNIQISIRPE